MNLPGTAAGSAAPNAHRQILKASTIIGGASLVNIVVGLVRSKFAALILGPAGFGLVGLLTNLVSTAAVIAGLGMATPVVSQLAAAVSRRENRRISALRRSLVLFSFLLGSVGGLLFWCAREPLAAAFLSSADQESRFLWLGLAVALTMGAANQTAVLNGYRQLGLMAFLQVIGAFLSTLAGVIILLVWREHAITAFVLTTPLAMVVVGAWTVTRLPSANCSVRLGEVFATGWALMTEGASFMLAGVVQMLGQLALRLVILRSLGEIAQGEFTAAWMISMTYIAFVLQAMGADYLPRLAAQIGRPASVNRMVNEQIEIALMLAAPLLIGVQALAPWLMHLLYSSEFAGATTILRWQVLGDVLKVASWPLGYILIAARRGKTYLMSEFLALATLTLTTWLMIGCIGPVAPGVGFVVMYVVYLPLVFALAKRQTAFAFTSAAGLNLIGVFAAVSATLLAGIWYDLAGAMVGCLLGLASVFYAIFRLRQLDAIPARLVRLLELVQRALRFR